MLYIFTFLLAFCSIAYELILGQTLSAFLGNTVLRYSVTIGLYMCSMGVGALLFNNKLKRHPLVGLQMVELALGVLGGSSVILLFLLSGLIGSVTIISLIAHTTIIVIGILTGLEIPLLMEIRSREKPDCDGTLLGIDYIGAFFGTVLFAFYFYPVVGLVLSAFVVAMLNSLVGLLLICKEQLVAQSRLKLFHRFVFCHGVLLIALGYGAYNWRDLEKQLLNVYLNVGQNQMEDLNGR